MITGIRIKNFKGIRDTGRISLGPFHLLIGANASGKSTFLDALDFVKSCVESDVVSAVARRVPNYNDLTFNRQGGHIEFDLWLDLGHEFHYRAVLAPHDESGVAVHEELLQRTTVDLPPLNLLGKTVNGKYFLYFQVDEYEHPFEFGPHRLALSQTPLDVHQFRDAIGVRTFITRSICSIDVDPKTMRQPCSSGSPAVLLRDGSNLARVAGILLKSDPAEFRRWIVNLRHALDDIEDITWAKLEGNSTEYLTLKYSSGFACPSWLLSDGTLRTLALTILAHAWSQPGVVLVEEPENGVHPRALEIVLGALQAVTDGQVLVTTQSPLVVQEIGKDCLLAFTRDEDGIRIQSGLDHPSLADWRGVPDLATVFAARVLG